MSSREIVIASRNLHKVREMREMLKALSDLDILSLRDFPNYSPAEETGSTFEEIAKQKAIHAAEQLKKWVLADDSGIVVPSLGGDPGIYSRRYAGNEATDVENRKKLLLALEGKKGLDRSAHFHCALALASPEGEVKVVLGTCAGSIIEKAKGGQGFGYDPIFVKNDYDKTFSELDSHTKNRVSHRRKAIDKLLSTLEAQVF